MSSQQLSTPSSSSLDIASDHVCYVQCNFCNTILAVSVPGTILFNVVTVRCGHCANLLSVNMASLLQALPNHITSSTNQQLHQHQHNQDLLLLHHHNHRQSLQNHNHNASLDHEEDFRRKDCGSSSSSSSSPTKRNKVNSHDLLPSSMQQVHNQDDHRQRPLPRMLPVRPPEKRQRVPSAYNRFIKEEIQRIKSSNPDISHREAFSTAAKNWAHFPHIHFGLTVDGNKQVKIDGAFAGEAGMQKTQDFY